MSSGKRCTLLSFIAMVSSIALLISTIPVIRDAVQIIDYQVYRRLLTVILVMFSLSLFGLITIIIAIFSKSGSIVSSFCLLFHVIVTFILLTVLSYLLCPFVHRWIMIVLKHCFP